MLKANGTIPMFQYEPKHFSFILSEEEDGDSIFDSILREKWKDAEANGIFRYTLNIKEYHILEGKHGFLTQLNPDRASNRRKPENIAFMSQPFDHNRFNFTKISDQEILLDVGDGDGNDVIAVNVSPIEQGHCLFLSERFQCRPQRITEKSLGKAIELLLLSNSPYLRVIFNSLCAHASVNHLHWHLYYLRHRMPLENIKVHNLKGPVFVLNDFPARGFCLKLSCFPGNDVQELVSWAYMIVNHLQSHEVAHNVYISRAKTTSNNETKEYNDLRIYIWPRKPSTGVKNTTAFVPAVCELFGHLSVKCKEEYDNLKEDTVAEILRDVTVDTFEAVKDKILMIIEDCMKTKNYVDIQDCNI